MPIDSCHSPTIHHQQTCQETPQRFNHDVAFGFVVLLQKLQIETIGKEFTPSRYYQSLGMRRLFYNVESIREQRYHGGIKDILTTIQAERKDTGSRIAWRK